MTLSLRPYQQEAIQAVLDARRLGVKRQVIHLPTGAGKTVIFARLAAMARRGVLVLAHRSELLDQAVDKLRRTFAQLGLATEGVLGLEQAGAQAQAGARVVVASLRSLHTNRLARLISERDFGLVVYDECHHAPATDNRRVLEDLGVFSSDWTGTLLGFTATPQRADGQPLSDIFEKVVYSKGLIEMIDEGWLVPLRGFRVATNARVSGVFRDDLEIESEDLGLDIQERNALVARSIQELARDRRTLVFCVTVNHARHVALALRRLGVSAGLVHGELPPDERAQVLADFASGRLQVLTNVGVLTEGFDDPGVSCVAIARPTRSQALYVQCVGRGTRPHPGKTDCLVLDFVDASDIPLVTLPVLWGLPRELDLEGEDPREAANFVRHLPFDLDSFLVEAGSLTLQELKDRAAAFDPLARQSTSEVLAISPFAWSSLGRRGLVLHIRGNRQLTEIRLSPESRPGRAKRWVVRWDEKVVADYANAELAVEAVDFEVRRRGRRFEADALPEAPWRLGPPPENLLAELAHFPGLPPARTYGEALQLLGLAQALQTRVPDNTEKSPKTWKPKRSTAKSGGSQ